MTFDKVSVIGLGYIGLPTAAILASQGIEVVGVDVIQKVVDIINQGRIHIIEADLEQLVQKVVQSGHLRATTKPERADAFIIAVPTPFKDGHKPDVSYIKAAANSIAPVLEKGNLVILESTSPVGTTEELSVWLAEMRPDLKFPHQEGDDADIQIAYCPERVLPGKILKELVANDRVIGGLSAHSTEKAIALYKTFVKGKCIPTNARTAEMSKLTENAFRDVNIAFANELSLICDQLDIDVWELIALANRHPRVNILQPGPGVGGHCIAVDPWFIVDKTPEQAKLIKTAREINDYKPKYVVERVLEAIKEIENPVIACLGLAYKANIDDLRESPALKIVEELANAKVGNLLVSEPHIKILPPSLQKMPHVHLVSRDDAIQRADVILLLVDHSSFKTLKHGNLENKLIFDTKGAWQEIIK